MSSHHFALSADDIVLDSLPDSVEETIRKRDKWVAARRGGSAGLEFLVSDVQRWTPGRTVRVAFLGGNEQLHRDIEDATRVITEACNLKLDFRETSNGPYRTWSEQDTDYAAEIRVSFDMGGYFSLVGTDSINPAIGVATEGVGGRPRQRSLNLGGFDVQRPETWRGTARHEFLHALSFHHSHQNMRGPCEQEFRWDDDPGYQPTRDARGVFVSDAAGRRPGIYTYLSGPPNSWSKARVDHNLRSQIDDPNVVAGPFDAASVMLYRFPPLFYKKVPSGCAPTGDGTDLSDGDRRGLRLLYPQSAADLEAVSAAQQTLAAALEKRAEAARNRSREGLETPAGEAEYFERATAETLRRALAGRSRLEGD
jgi:hypothetical protein